MARYTMCPQRRKPFRLAEKQPDLFDWANAIAAENSATPLPRVVRIISHRFALSPSIARLVAEHAGFRMEANHG